MEFNKDSGKRFMGVRGGRKEIMDLISPCGPVYQAGTLITTGSLGAGFIGGLIAVLIIAAFITYLCIHANKKLKAEYALD